MTICVGCVFLHLNVSAHFFLFLYFFNVFLFVIPLLQLLRCFIFPLVLIL